MGVEAREGLITMMVQPERLARKRRKGKQEMTKEQLVEYNKLLQRHGAIEVVVVRGFKSRWVNPVRNANGKLVDIVKEAAYSEGERIRLYSWRPEGCHIKSESNPEMFVFWEELEKGELNIVEIF